MIISFIKNKVFRYVIIVKILFIVLLICFVKTILKLIFIL